MIVLGDTNLSFLGCSFLSGQGLVFCACLRAKGEFIQTEPAGCYCIFCTDSPTDTTTSTPHIHFNFISSRDAKSAKVLAGFKKKPKEALFYWNICYNLAGWLGGLVPCTSFEHLWDPAQFFFGVLCHLGGLQPGQVFSERMPWHYE